MPRDARVWFWGDFFGPILALIVNMMKKYLAPFARLGLLTVVIVVSFGGSIGFASNASSSLAPTLAPNNEKFLGRQSYIPVVTQKLEKPSLIYTDIPIDRLSGQDTAFF